MKNEFYTPLEKMTAVLEAAREQGRAEILAKIADALAPVAPQRVSRPRKDRPSRVRLCTNCGKPGHYKNGCKAKKKAG